MATNNLKQILIQEGLTQADFIKRSGLDLSSGTLNKVINGKRIVSETSKYKILNALNKLFPNKYKIEDIFPKA